MRGYCNSCKKKQSLMNGRKELVTSEGRLGALQYRLVIKGSCKSCGSKVFAFISNRSRISTGKQILRSTFSLFSRRGM